MALRRSVLTGLPLKRISGDPSKAISSLGIRKLYNKHGKSRNENRNAPKTLVQTDGKRAIRKLKAHQTKGMCKMLTNLQVATIDQFGIGKEPRDQARRIAGKLFDRAYTRGMQSQLLAKLTGKTNKLKTLSRRPAAARQTNGVIVVALSTIVGSEGRSEDFDAGFNPLKQHNREKWIGIAAAQKMGVVLPAVELVQNGREFYIRDGHHRISVAKALGQFEIEARIVN